MKMYKMMRILALALLFLVPKIGFADCCSDEDIFVPCEKTYFLPDQVAVAQEGIFINLSDEWTQTDALFADALGLFIISKKNNAHRGNCDSGQAQCPKKSCRKCVSQTYEHCPYCGTTM